MRKCFQVIIYMSWFWLDKSKNFSNILSCNISLQDWPNSKNPFKQSAYQSWTKDCLTKLNLQNWLNYNLPHSWNIQSRILFRFQWLFEWDQCTFHELTWPTFRYGNFTNSLFPIPMKLIVFQEHLLTMICFLQRVDKRSTSMLNLFHIGGTWLGVCGNDFLDLYKIGVDTNILIITGY